MRVVVRCRRRLCNNNIAIRREWINSIFGRRRHDGARRTAMNEMDAELEENEDSIDEKGSVGVDVGEDERDTIRR